MIDRDPRGSRDPKVLRLPNSRRVPRPRDPARPAPLGRASAGALGAGPGSGLQDRLIPYDAASLATPDQEDSRARLGPISVRVIRAPGASRAATRRPSRGDRRAQLGAGCEPRLGAAGGRRRPPARPLPHGRTVAPMQAATATRRGPRGQADDAAPGTAGRLRRTGHVGGSIRGRPALYWGRLRGSVASPAKPPGVAPHPRVRPGCGRRTSARELALPLGLEGATGTRPGRARAGVAIRRPVEGEPGTSRAAHGAGHTAGSRPHSRRVSVPSALGTRPGVGSGLAWEGTLVWKVSAGARRCPTRARRS